MQILDINLTIQHCLRWYDTSKFCILLFNLIWTSDVNKKITFILIFTISIFVSGPCLNTGVQTACHCCLLIGGLLLLRYFLDFFNFLSVALSPFPTFFHILSPHASTRVFLLLLLPPLFPHLSSCHWQLCSWGALGRGGREKTKIWFSGSYLDFLQIGWKIRRSVYSYATQYPFPPNPLPSKSKTLTADHRGSSHQHKCAICDKASPCFVPKTMTSLGTQRAKQRIWRSWCKMQGGRKRETYCTMKCMQT